LASVLRDGDYWLIFEGQPETKRKFNTTLTYRDFVQSLPPHPDDPGETKWIDIQIGGQSRTIHTSKAYKEVFLPFVELWKDKMVPVDWWYNPEEA
jgi:hypothetical protein